MLTKLSITVLKYILESLNRIKGTSFPLHSYRTLSVSSVVFLSYLTLTCDSFNILLTSITHYMKLVKPAFPNNQLEVSLSYCE